MNNYCSSAPPESVRVCGKELMIRTDFLIWISILRLIRKLDSTGDEQAIKNNNEVIKEIFETVFINPLDAKDLPANKVLQAIEEFSHGYPKEHSATNSSVSEDNTPTISFEYDLDLIAIAIRNQSGIDLSYRRKEPFHWWLFLLEFSALEDRHAIVKIINARSYTGDNKELIALREQERIPDIYFKTQTELREDEAFDRYFA